MNQDRMTDLALAIVHSANAVEDLAYLVDKSRDEKVLKARTEQARKNLSEALRRLDALTNGRVTVGIGRRRISDPTKML